MSVLCLTSSVFQKFCSNFHSSTYKIVGSPLNRLKEIACHPVKHRIVSGIYHWREDDKESRSQKEKKRGGKLVTVKQVCKHSHNTVMSASDIRRPASVIHFSYIELNERMQGHTISHMSQTPEMSSQSTPLCESSQSTPICEAKQQLIQIYIRNMH